MCCNLQLAKLWELFHYKMIFNLISMNSKAVLGGKYIIIIDYATLRFRMTQDSVGSLTLLS